jgi:hypothetical protein
MNGGKGIMGALSDRLAVARASRPYRDVPVTLDGEVAAERDRLAEMLGTASNDVRLGAKSEAQEIQEKIDELTLDASDKLVLRFTRLPGRDWARITSRHPVRPGVGIDMHFGYNYDAVCEDAATYSDPKTQESFGALIEDGERVELSREEWAELFDVLAGSDIESIRDAIWGLNEYEPEQRLQALVKASGAATRSDEK